MDCIRSFDIFDTLIARRCIHPNCVFLQMEQRLNRPGFLRARVLASCLAAVKNQGSHTLSSIYDELGPLLGADRDELNRIQELEISVEMENVVPIVENIEKLSVDSVLITDMYLPEEVIRSLLLKAGVGPHHMIFRSSDGKLRGWLWKSLLDNGFCFDHLGDNEHSDLKTALGAGMKASLTTISCPTFFEEKLLRLNLNDIAFSIREARLRTKIPSLNLSLFEFEDFGRNVKDFLVSLQAEVNLALLVKLALFVIDSCGCEVVKTRLLFSSRGSYLLYRLCSTLVDRMKLDHLECVYWLSSRDARHKLSSDYLEYCRDAAGGCHVKFIDITGSGLSFAKFQKGLASIGLSESDFLIGIQTEFRNHDEKKKAFVRAGIPLDDGDFPVRRCCSALEVFGVDEMGFPEFLNFSPEGKCLDVVSVKGLFVPVRECYEFEQCAAEMVRFSSEYCVGLVESLAALISRDYELIKCQVADPSFDQVLRMSFHKYYPDAGKLFNRYYRSGHMQSERLHLRRVYS